MSFLQDPFTRGPLRDPVSAIGAGIGGVGSLLGGILGSHAANKAADIQNTNAQRVAQNAQQATASAQGGEAGALIAGNNSVQSGTTAANATIGDASQHGLAALQDVYGQQSSNLNPYLQAGQQGLQQLLAGTGQGGNLTQQFTAPSAEDARNQPGYQFALQQGMKALQNSAAASGQLQGGGNLKAITQYAQGLADTNYQNVYNNAFNTFQANRQNNLQNISALTGLGQFGTGQYNTAASQYGQAANQNYLQSGLQQGQNSFNSGQSQAQNQFRASEYQGNAGMQGAQIVGNALTGGANAQAAGVVGGANAWQGALGGLTNAAQYYGLSSQLGQYNPYSYPSATPNFTPYSQGSPFSSTPQYVPPAQIYSAPQLPSIYETTPRAPQWNQ